ncbi:MAG: DNA topoisomerase (ATP-hydrolyzing) subunit A [Oscillospiraceae bacterium]|nr:DNA topoisomerase (ATP-hydrolyzing) subunit A [Oscillospiraceae bacterium]
MAKKSKKEEAPRRAVGINAEIEGAGSVVETPVSETLRKNYMPYAMSVIVSRALPEIDGFKPSHRKLLYTMYKMGLLTGGLTKSANVVGQTMKLNPHGDATIYETMVRLARGNETLLHAYVESKGNFGKAYSRDMAYAAPRYTEVKLASISGELFSDINKDTVDFVENYDATTTEPTLLPATFPTVLVNSNIGIAVGMASQICSFNLAEVCETVVALIKNPEHDIASTLKAPDFAGGGLLIYDEAPVRQAYETGRGTIKIRSKYEIVKNRIEITEIPPTTTVEAIMDKIAELVKSGKVRELSDMRDETDLRGLRLTLDLKRGADGEKLMQKLFRLTPLEDGFSCNFTLLIKGSPRLLGVRDILNEWIDFRRGCVRRRAAFDLKNRSERLHLLEGLSKILLDIDKAIKIVRETEEEKEVVPNLMIGFGIDETQAEYVAEIKLRQLNREYILNRVGESEKLREEIADLKDILASSKRVDKIIMLEQAEVAKKYAQARKTKIIYETPEAYVEEETALPDYPVTVFFTREGYFKKITPQSLRMSGEQALKEGDEIIYSLECRNDAYLLFFTDKGRAYKSRAADFADGKASAMGDYVPSELEMEEGERAIACIAANSFEGHLIFFYANGKAAKVPLASYETKTNRKKLTGAFNIKSPLVAVYRCEGEREFGLFSDSGRLLLASTALISEKQSRDTLGVQIMTLKKNTSLARALPAEALELADAKRYRTRNLPAAGAPLREEDRVQQLEFQA